MEDLVRVLGVGAYVVLGLLAGWRGARSGAAGRWAVNAFLVYALGVSFGVGLLQREMWPFSNWPLVAGIHGPTARHPRLIAVDRLGREHEVDYRAWEPFVVDELLAWADAYFLELDPSDRTVAAAYLLELAEAARRRAVGGESVGAVGSRLGPLTAPYFLLHPAWWDTPGTAPREPLVGLRLYYETWHLEERLADPSAVERSLAYEYLRP